MKNTKITAQQTTTGDAHKQTSEPPFTWHSLVRIHVCLTALLWGRNKIETGKCFNSSFNSSPGSCMCMQSCNYIEWGPIRWIRASPFKSHFGPFITLRATDRDTVGCPGNRRRASWTARSSDLHLTPFFSGACNQMRHSVNHAMWYTLCNWSRSLQLQAENLLP